MSEQWFLDLDGVRSGPYQTSEVMSLVAEGEILPHHQIANELKSQKWMTILEWRLNQNRNAPISPVQEKTIPVETPKTIPPTVEVEVKVEVPKDILKEAVKEEKKQEEVVTPIKATPPPTQSGPKRDPMAEMFDMLQNTKQKREVKSQHSHANAQTHSHPHANHNHAITAHHVADSAEKNISQKSNLWKTILVGAIVTAIGFALGQMFQHQKANETTTASTPTKPAIPAPTTTTVTETNTPTDRPPHAVTVDRSTDKMTIRAQVSSNQNTSASVSPTPEHIKDIQELKDLKKELLELKALKDEMRNNNEPSHIENAPNINNNSEPDTGAPDGAVDEYGNPENPEKEVHY